jgi:pimeloyl-ACP methyl ester carboxylesterase
VRAAEIRDTGKLLGSTLDEFAVATRDVHRAVSGRVFGLLGNAGRPIQLCHDVVFEVVFGSVRAGVRYAPLIAGYGFAHRGDGVSVHESRRGRVNLAKINGILGDRVADEAASLATPMLLRTQLGRCARDVDAIIGDGLPVTGRVVIFLHGLCESDSCWELGAERAWGRRHISYGTKLAADAGWTVLYASYNSGLRISANGVDLAGLLEELVAGWPVPIDEVALVGHSMGGLVARSACHHGVLAGHRWVSELRTVVLLGAPNLGAPLERVVNQGTHVLGLLPETRPFSGLLNRRSNGIRDLRHGSLVEQDWRDFELDDPIDHCTEVALLPAVNYYVVGATLTRTPDSPLAPLLGDLLVQWTSATGQHPVRRIPFQEDGWMHLGRASHFDLLNRPAVYDQLRRWLD